MISKNQKRNSLTQHSNENLIKVYIESQLDGSMAKKHFTIIIELKTSKKLLKM